MMIRKLVEQILGLKVEQIQEGEEFCYKASQPGVIDNILEATGMTECDGKDTPTSSNLPLGLELDSKLAEKNF
eukprot:4217614-Ditylum_brightwellii.AAC.1